MHMYGCAYIHMYRYAYTVAEHMSANREYATRAYKMPAHAYMHCLFCMWRSIVSVPCAFMTLLSIAPTRKTRLVVQHRPQGIRIRPFEHNQEQTSRNVTNCHETSFNITKRHGRIHVHTHSHHHVPVLCSKRVRPPLTMSV
jgi:hypothetical protein